jgi:biopolymer transport protein ExbD
MARSIKPIEGDETVHYVSPRAKRGLEKAKISVPMTPMIDVTFQLLIYFILTTTFRQIEGQIPGTLPREGTSGHQTIRELQDPIKITLHPTGAANEGVLYEISGVHERITDRQALKSVLATRKAADGADNLVIIKPKSGVRWRFVVEVFNQVVANAFSNIAFQSATL